MAMTSITASEAKPREIAAARDRQEKERAIERLATHSAMYGNAAGQVTGITGPTGGVAYNGVAGLQDPYAMAEFIRIYQQQEAKKMMDQRMGSTVLHHTEIRRIENGFLVYIAVKENEASKIFYAESVEEASKVLVGELVKREILED